MVRSRGLVGLVALGALVAARPVAAFQVSEVQVSPPSVTLTAGQQQSVFATAYDNSGNVVPTAQFTWSSADPNIARVEPDNSSPGVAVIVGVGAGRVEIRARSGNRTGTVSVTVQGGAPGAPPPQVGTGAAAVLRIEPQNILMLPSEQRQLSPLFLKADGSPAAPQSITWTSLNTAIATVNTNGLVTALSEGQAAIQASSGTGLQVVAPVAVSSAQFGFSIPILSLSPGEEKSVDVVVPSQNNRVLLASSLSWLSTNSSVVTVSPVGVIHAVGAGTAQVVASGFLQQHSLEVRVHRPVTSMDLTPGPSLGPVVVPFNGTRTFVATALAADGTPVPEAPMVWTVADTTVARFDPASLTITGLALGSTTLHLRGPGPDVLEADWEIRVVAGGLVVNPMRRGIGVRDMVAFAAQFTDSAGTPISPASGHVWTSSDTAVVRVTSSGLATAVGRGHAAIIAATPWGAADTADLYVQGELIFVSTRAGSPDLWAVDRGSLNVATHVTDDPGVEVGAAFSPDGSRIAFVSTRDGNAEIYLANADGSGTRRLTNTPGNEDGPVFSRDGSHIYFSYAETGSRMQVWVMNVDGTGRRTLTQDASATNFQPAVGPDGSVAFTSTRDGNYEIYVMGADGANQRNVTQTPGKETAPQWFPDGQLGYLVEQRAGATIESRVVRRQLPSGQATPLSPAGLMVTDFAVSRDGQVLALQVESFGQSGTITRHLYVLPMAGGGPQQFPTTSPDEQQSSPAWR